MDRQQNRIKHISASLNIPLEFVEKTIQLLEGGATIPFISRYRKEQTNGLDEVQVGQIAMMHQKLIEVDKRRDSIINSIEEQGKMTDELNQKLNATYLLSELEDIYLPFRPKRKTRATVAIELGLEPLAKMIMKQDNLNVQEKAATFITDKVPDTDAAIKGALDIIAEWINENAHARNRIRRLIETEGIITSEIIKGKEAEGVKYDDYYHYSEPVRRCPSHRFLAVKRGENEGFLKTTLHPKEEHAIAELEHIFIKGKNESSNLVKNAVKDSYKRLMLPSLENEMMNVYKEKADEDAIKVFAENLRQLLLAPPLGQKRILAIDPGYRTGCKVVCIDEQGNLLHNETIYPHSPQNEHVQASKKISSMAEKYKIDAIAIGNGTASRETEFFIKNVRFNRKVQVYVVSEAGASVYSASPVAREEFPEYDVTVRGSVSIGRRLMDPLAELVKIDPKSIGVGQYQHDVDQKMLKESLDRVVESCVNWVGVNLNTASKHLLTYVSGLSQQLAQNIVDFRAENGPFGSRSELRKVPRLGEKAFEQCAGFLRIPGAKNPLDNSAVHPESYHVAEKMAVSLSCELSALVSNEKLVSKIKAESFVTDKTGLPTIVDILTELKKPGRDPRLFVKVFEFAEGIRKIEDLQVGMVLPGIVTNITNFGAFVDVGVKQDGLVHISQLADAFVKNPADVVKLHQHVKVRVTEVDIPRKRIQLSMKNIKE